MKIAKLLYRCRMCGKVFAGLEGGAGVITNALTALTVAETDGGRSGHVACRHEIHRHCPDRGAIGFGDIIGMEEEGS